MAVLKANFGHGEITTIVCDEIEVESKLESLYDDGAISVSVIDNSQVVGMTDYEILSKAHALITRAITEEGIFGEGDGANFIVFENAKRLVQEYNKACADGTISNEPV